MALVVAAAVAAVAFSPGAGAWRQLTDPDARVSSDSPSRLTTTASARARYWREGFDVWRAHRWKGAGAGGFATARRRYSRDPGRTRHAHGYVPQTFADLGLVGIAISLSLLLGWGVAARHSFGRRSDDEAPPGERLAALTLLATAVVAGVHFLVDWTWFVPAPAVAGLVCAGWVAGRGPLGPPGLRLARPGRSPARLAAAAATALVALLAAWTVLQPLRAERKNDEARAAFEKGDFSAARSAALAARERDPLSLEPLYTLADVEDAAGRPAGTYAALMEATEIAPEDGDAWLRLGEYSTSQGRTGLAWAAITAAALRDPWLPNIQRMLEQARTALEREQARAAGSPRGP